MEPLSQQEYDSLTMDERIAHSNKGTKVLHASEILCMIQTVPVNGVPQAFLVYANGQRFPHNLNDQAYNFLKHYSHLNPNIQLDLEDIKHEFAKWDAFLDQNNRITFSDTQTMGAMSRLFSLLLYSRKESNGEQYNFMEQLKERMDEVYNSSSKISEDLKQYRRSRDSDFIRS